MRKTILLVAVAVLATISFPGIGTGEITTSHGGALSDVFTSTDPGICSGEDPVGPAPAALLPTAVEFGTESHLLASFTSTWSGPGKETELVLTLELSNAAGTVASSPDWIAQGGSQGITIHTTGTVMWTFEDVPEGAYTVAATARVAGFAGAVHGRDGATLQGCAMSVFVAPTA